MRIIKIEKEGDHSFAIAEAIKVLEEGGTIVYPTDTVYGIGCDATNESAVKKIYDIKGRDTTKALPILIKDISWAEKFGEVNDMHRKLAAKLWPGKVTIVFPRDAEFPKVGLRVSGHKFVQGLLDAKDIAIIGTSANISGEPATVDINEVIAAMEKQKVQPDLIIDAGILPPSESSVIIECITDTPKIIRGEITPEIEEALKSL